MEKLQIKTIPYSSDNYCYLIHHTASGKTALIDCGDAMPVIKQLKILNWDLNAIFLAHHHYDHVNGTSSVRNAFPRVTVYSPAGEDRINIPSTKVKDGDLIPLGPLNIEAVSVPAHTKSCTNYYIEGNLFTSDTLFSVGCGRLFEGNASDLVKAMDRIAGYPRETRIYFGHEYTLDNLSFALTVEPDNQDSLIYKEQCNNILRKGGFTTPTTLDIELKVNPFLRIDEQDVLKYIDPSGRYNRTERLGRLRRAKDRF